MAATYKLISAVTVGAGGSSTISFSSIPATYTDICLKLSARSTSNTSGQTTTYVNLTFNGDSGAYYDQRNVSAFFGGTISNQNWSNQNSFYVYQIDASTATSNIFSNTEIYVPNYTSTSNKSISNDGVAENNISSGTDRVIALVAGLYHPSSNIAISSVSLTTGGAGDFAQYTTAYLYGIKSS